MSLDRYREKWREAPRGSDTDGRIFSSDLLTLPDDAMLAAWQEMAERRYVGELGWLGPLYGDHFRDRRVLELGSGLGFDGLRFAALGAHWTFADIVPDNLQVIRRIATLKGLAERTRFHLIPDDLSFGALPSDYDAVWVFGSIHHVPFEIARREALAVLPHLKAGGRWMELVYPRERWLREGAPAFEDWGKLTDGERTPWAEWHDAEKIRRRLEPARLRAVLDFEFCSHNYRWIDFEYLGMAAEAPQATPVDLMATAKFELKSGQRPVFAGTRWALSVPAGLFRPGATVDLRDAGASFEAVALDLEVKVTSGAIGFGLVDEAGAYLPGGETVVEAGPDWRPLTLRSMGAQKPATLAVRGMEARRKSAIEVRSATLRPAR
ncbi:MAG TPA: class I SAM-dependent methyltransferase [Reyranella sp.]|nr:class I SAM-dependent methyltransferase [Reyranella sp.]